MIEPVFCQNCGRLCKEVYKGSNGLLYCSRDCAITGYLIDKYEGLIFLVITLLIPAMALTAQYMQVKYSPTTQTQEQGEGDNDKEQ